MTTPGRPAKLKPATSKGHSGPAVRQCRPTWYQVLGACRPRWGSLASSGRPVVVSRPETTHAFEPSSAPAPSRAGTASSARAAEVSAPCAGPASRGSDDSGPVTRDGAAPPTGGTRDALPAAAAVAALGGTIGWCRSKG